MNNKIWIAVIGVALILIGIGIGRLFMPAKIIEVPIESKYKRMDDSLRQIIVEDSLIMTVLYSRVRNADSLMDLKIIKYKTDVTKIKKFTPTERLGYLDSLFRTNGLGNMPVQ